MSAHAQWRGRRGKAHGSVVASYKHESRFKRTALMESRLDRQRRLTHTTMHA